MHGVREPFLYYLGNVDWRKNVLGLVDAYALLPAEIREGIPARADLRRECLVPAVLTETASSDGPRADRVISTGPAWRRGDPRRSADGAALFLSPSLI